MNNKEAALKETDRQQEFEKGGGQSIEQNRTELSKQSLLRLLPNKNQWKEGKVTEGQFAFVSGTIIVDEKQGG